MIVFADKIRRWEEGEDLFELIKKKVYEKKLSLSQVSNSWHLRRKRKNIEKERKINWVGGGNARDMPAICK